MSSSTERLIEDAQDRYGWTDATLLEILAGYIAGQDSDDALADHLAEHGPDDSDQDETGGPLP